MEKLVRERRAGSWAGRPAVAVLALAVLVAAACTPTTRVDPPQAGEPARIEARCVGVDDGDSLRVVLGEREARVRLHGIDCPEKGQAFGDAARDFTRERALDRTVTLQVVDTDRYGRLVSQVTVGGENLNLALVAAGLAWHSTLHSQDPALAAAQERARNDGRGLWAEADPLPPWKFRQQQREAHATPKPAT